MKKTCETCKWFDAGSSGLASAYTLACALQGAWPRSSDLGIATLADKDGACTFNPEPVRKHKHDSCGQYCSGK